MKKYLDLKLMTSMALLMPNLIFAGGVEVVTPVYPHSFYIAGNGGVFQGIFNTLYADQTDVITQDIALTLQQRGYTGGGAIGYSYLFHQQYFVGLEFDFNANSNTAYFASGASTAAFTDATKINYHADLTFIPGVMLTDTLAGYFKIGGSVAWICDQLISPVGYNPFYAYYFTNTRLGGVAAGLGLKKFLNPHLAIFSEYVYHDYNNAHFSNFLNFTAEYTHSAHIYSHMVTIGVAAYL